VEQEKAIAETPMMPQYMPRFSVRRLATM